MKQKDYKSTKETIKSEKTDTYDLCIYHKNGRIIIPTNIERNDKVILGGLDCIDPYSHNRVIEVY